MPSPRPVVVAFLAVLALSPAPLHAAEEKPLRRIAFGSCADQERPQPIWGRVVAAKPDLFLFIGDTVYADTTDMDVMRAKYKKLADLPGWQKLLSTCPVMATWDDHDYGKNDAGAEYPKKKEAQQVFLDFFHEPKDSPRRKQEGVYTAKVFGPPGRRVQVILLDTRYHRSPLKKRARPSQGEGPYVANTDTSATMLGEAQWKWLEQQLKVPAEVRLLASSIQVVAEDHGYEKWMNMPRQRERLFNLIRDTGAGGVVILSGDRHLAELSQMDAGVGYPLYDLTSSGINQAALKWRKLEANRHRVATMNRGNNFGLVAIDWDHPEPRVRLQIHDEEGDITIQEKVPLKVLRPGFLRVGASGVPRLADSGEPLTAAEVKKRVGQQVTLELTVQATGASGGNVFLNSAADFRSEDNFTVVLGKEARSKLREAGVEDPRAHFDGKRVRVTGKLTLFRGRPQIVVDDPKQIQRVER
ncbi:MAG TPA: alkaline phosphatase D family protein [Gemmataceae bacterium]|nr:alkaline phosphatase D family protein [Gemmataceae bacterium]